MPALETTICWIKEPVAMGPSCWSSETALLKPSLLEPTWCSWAIDLGQLEGQPASNLLLDVWSTLSNSGKRNMAAAYMANRGQSRLIVLVIGMLVVSGLIVIVDRMRHEGVESYV